MFNKRDEATGEAGYSSYGDSSSSSYTPSASPSPSPSPSAGRRDVAVIGASIRINGDLQGDEDLLIQGQVKGTVQLKNNSLTVGEKGSVKANVYAKSVTVEGQMEGDLYGSENVNIRRSANVKGNIVSPRVCLEDGAKFKGSIEMDPEALREVFKDNKPATPLNAMGSAAKVEDKPQAKTAAAS